jgi:hypothetical protein
MPGMQTHAHTPRARNGEPQPAALQTSEPASAKRDLTSWWRQFSKRPTKKEDEKGETASRRSVWLRPYGLGVLSSPGASEKAEAPVRLRPHRPPPNIRRMPLLTCIVTHRCPTRNLRCTSHPEHTLRERCDIAVQRARGKLHLRLRAHRSRKMRRLSLAHC